MFPARGRLMRPPLVENSGNKSLGFYGEIGSSPSLPSQKPMAAPRSRLKSFQLTTFVPELLSACGSPLAPGRLSLLHAG